MEDSILTSIKKLLGITEQYTHFDQDLIIHINTILAILQQMGIGPKSGFRITDDSQKWSDFLDGDTQLDMVRTFVYLRVKQLFDPPQSSSLSQASDNVIKEIEWRMYSHSNFGEGES